jgi:pimeloyl-ACP methyl ester carboxylesterase
VVTALSVAIRVWPSACVPERCSRPNRFATASGSPTSLNTCSRVLGCRLIDGAGHWVQQEQPERVTELLLQLLRR